MSINPVHESGPRRNWAGGTGLFGGGAHEDFLGIQEAHASTGMMDLMTPLEVEVVLGWRDGPSSLQWAGGAHVLPERGRFCYKKRLQVSEGATH